MKKYFVSSAIGLLVILLPFNALSQTLVGSTVSLSINYPVFGVGATIPNVAVIGDGVEYPVFTLHYNNGATIDAPMVVDIGANTIDFSWQGSAPTGLTAFDGPVFSFGIGSPIIGGVTVDDSSINFPSQTQVGYSNNKIWVNFAGGYVFNTDSHVRLNVSLVPESETYAMLLVGLGLMAGVARRKQK